MTQKTMMLAWLLLAALASFLLWKTLSQEAHLRGADAYYYALQSHYYAVTGAVKIPDPSFIHRVNGSLESWGWSTEQAIRFWTCLSLFLSFLTAWILALLPPRKPLAISSLLLMLYLLSSSQLFMALEFPKMFSGVLLLPLWFCPLLGRRPWLSLLPAAASVWLHKAALPWALLWIAGLFLFPRLRRFRSGGKGGVLALAAVLLAAGGLLYFSPQGQRLSFANLQVGYWSLLLRSHLPIGLRVEMLLAPLVYALCAWRARGESAWRILLPLALCLPAFLPLGVGEVWSVGERYALCVPSILWSGSLFLLAGIPEKSSWAWMGCMLLPLALFPASRLAGAHPASIDPDFQAYERVVEELKDRDIPMLIAHKGLVFSYKYKLMREAFPYEPESHWDKKRLWRLLYAIRPEELDYYLPESCSWGSGLVQALAEPDYALIREDCWEIFRSKVPSGENEDLYHRIWGTWLNPSQKRPAFLYEKHRSDAIEEFPALPPESRP